MLEMITQDFDVALVANTDEGAVFAASRRDVWHFVLATTDRPAQNMVQLGIRQFHWPRYSVASSLDSGSARPLPPQIAEMGITLVNDGVQVNLGSNQYRLPADLLARMREDIPVLQRAKASVIAKGERYAVDSARTSAGHPVLSTSRPLAEAIAFEREARGTLDPTDFGVYSAYCTWRDFVHDDDDRKANIAQGMAREMVGWNTASFGDETYWDEVASIQMGLWREVLWGRGVQADYEPLATAFNATFEQLSSIQFAQFILMNGMHPGGPFHPLALLFNAMDLDSYLESRTRGFQPDSVEEQEIRTQTSFIQLLAIDANGDAGVH